MPGQAETHEAGTLVIGVDGGGSRCTVVLARVTPAGVQELGRGLGGPANALTVGFEQAAENVARALDAAFATAGLDRRPVDAACLGLAGAGSTAIADRWLVWARASGVANAVDVMPDGLPAFGSDEAVAYGLVVIAGTGSIVWGRRPGGSLERCGGRGSLAGDEGSGWWVATEGLRAAVRMADGWGEATSLLERACVRFRVSDATEIPATLALPTTTRAAIAAFATDVVAAAGEGDAVACRIAADAATLLARQAIALARRLGFSAGTFPLRLVGGLLCHAPKIREGLLTKLAAAELQPQAVILMPDLAAAAAAMAANQANDR